MAGLSRRPSARRGAPGLRAADDERLRLQRYGRAWVQAVETARRLVHEFGAARVVAAGELVHPERFGRGSEIELVVWGLHADVFGRAVAAGRPDALPATIRDGDHLSPAEAARVHAEGAELARRTGD